MGIRKIQLFDFRNIKKSTFEFSEGVTVIVGPNASGKTNILESLFLLSTGKSFHARIEEEMVNYNAEIGRVTGKVKEMNLEVILTRGLIDVGNSQPERVPRKKLLVNGVARRLIDFAGNFKVVLFGPWDLDLVTASPSLRRNFLDTVLAQADREYRRASLSYEKGLRQRNRLLLRIRDEGLSRSQLLFWDKLLIRNGNYISVKRGEFIDFINATGGLNDQEFDLTYDNSAISQGRLEQYINEEIASATTLVGPHRDDFIFNIGELRKSRSLDKFGSRGEQRMAILWLKLAELAFIENSIVDSASLTIRGESGRPTLLLDDIFSELDYEHRKVVVGVSDKQQTIITTVDEHFIEGLKKVEKILL